MISLPRSSVFLRTFTILLYTAGAGIAAQNADNPIVNPAAGAKFGPIPNAPECFTIAAEKGDPSKGPSVILARFAPLRCAVSLAYAQRNCNGRKRHTRDPDEG
jgi:hypothetical protein